MAHTHKPLKGALISVSYLLGQFIPAAGPGKQTPRMGRQIQPSPDTTGRRRGSGGVRGGMEWGGLLSAAILKIRQKPLSFRLDRPTVETPQLSPSFPEQTLPCYAEQAFPWCQLANGGFLGMGEIRGGLWGRLSF